jgi:hypothetical protein
MLEIERAGLEETGRQKLIEIRLALGLPERTSHGSADLGQLPEGGGDSAREEPAP